MASGKEIKLKIGTISNIKKITKTMEMVSVSKMKKMVARVSASKEYAVKALQLLANLALERNIEHPLLEQGKGEKNLLVVFASNKGLCGGFNVNISKKLSQIAKQSKRTLDVITIGKQAERAARRNNLSIVASFIEFNEKTGSDDFLVLKQILLDKMQGGEYRETWMLYTEFKSAVSYAPVNYQILPPNVETLKYIFVEEEREERYEYKLKSLSRYIVEPSPEEVVEQIVPKLLHASLYHAHLESQASEHSARMFAMKNASDNAGNLVDDLTLQYNKARQSAITQEISEIVGGAEALK
jgi:F-type H+-transporting ATPase subunit gamma